MGRPAARKIWSNLIELRAAVRETCAENFLRRHSMRWDPAWAEALQTSYDTERRRLVHGRAPALALTTALMNAARFLEESGVGLDDGWTPESYGDPARTAAFLAAQARCGDVGPAAARLQRWFSDFLPGDHWYPPSSGDDDDPPASLRSHLVKVFVRATRNGGEGLPEGMRGLFVKTDKLRTREMPTHRELAEISILCGEFPNVPEAKMKTKGEKKGAITSLTVTDVIGMEATTMQHAREHVLREDYDPVIGHDLAHEMGFSFEPRDAPKRVTAKRQRKG